MRVLIFGALGQDGLFLSELLITRGAEVFGFVRQNSVISFSNSISDVTYIKGNLLDRKDIEKAIKLAKPDAIYNLASLSSVKSSIDFPHLSLKINQNFVYELLDILKELQNAGNVPIKFLQASSSEMYGPIQEFPINEGSKFNPVSPYALHKANAHLAVIQSREKDSLHCSTAILFNHESYRRSPLFASRKITQSAYRIATGKQEFLELGNIETFRDWGFAGDYVEAMSMIVDATIPSDFVISTGKLMRLSDICEIAFDEVGISDWHPYIRINKELIRKNDLSGLIGDSSKIKNELGWIAKTPFEDVIRDMVSRENLL